MIRNYYSLFLSCRAGERTQLLLVFIYFLIDNFSAESQRLPNDESSFTIGIDPGQHLVRVPLQPRQQVGVLPQVVRPADVERREHRQRRALTENKRRDVDPILRSRVPAQAYIKTSRLSCFSQKYFFNVECRTHQQHQIFKCGKRELFDSEGVAPFNTGVVVAGVCLDKKFVFNTLHKYIGRQPVV
jgi:hypothetical protein